MNFSTIDTCQDFLSFQKNWEWLYKKLPNNKLFNSFMWNYSWYRSAYRRCQLFLVVAYEKKVENPLAIFPAMIDKKGCLRFIADTHSDYSTFLIDDSISNSKLYDVMKTFKKAIDSKPQIKEIELKNIAQKDRYIAIFENLFDYKQITYKSNASSYIVLEPKKSLFDSFDYLNSKQRSELKRIYKKNAHLKRNMLCRSSEKFPLGDIKSIIEEMINTGIRNEEFMNSGLLKIIESLYNENLIQIFCLKDNNEKVIAMNFIVHDSANANFLFWIDIYRNVPFINLSSYLYAIEWFSTHMESSFSVDFGRGLYDYKIKNFLPNIENQFTFYYSKGSYEYIRYLLKLSLLLSVKNFYKRNKKVINRILKR